MPVFAHKLLIFRVFSLMTSVVQAQVVGELVSAEQGAQPGARTTVALKLTHDPGWHTYWVAPGIGEATSIDWTLPEGWAAGDIDWPVPVKIYTEAGVVSGHGFEDVTYLPLDLIVAADAPRRGNRHPGCQRQMAHVRVRDLHPRGCRARAVSADR